MLLTIEAVVLCNADIGRIWCRYARKYLPVETEPASPDLPDADVLAKVHRLLGYGDHEIVDMMEVARSNVESVLGKVSEEKSNVSIMPIYGLKPFNPMGEIALYNGVALKSMPLTLLPFHFTILRMAGTANFSSRLHTNILTWSTPAPLTTPDNCQIGCLKVLQNMYPVRKRILTGRVMQFGQVHLSPFWMKAEQFASARESIPVKLAYSLLLIVALSASTCICAQTATLIPNSAISTDLSFDFALTIVENDLPANSR